MTTDNPSPPPTETGTAEMPRPSLPLPTLARLTAAKAVANTALRWIPPFLPTLERAFGASTTQLTTILGLGETAGLSTIIAGRHLDRGRERIVMVAGLSAISASSLIALAGSVWTFAIAFVVLVVGVGNFTVAGHAWISSRVDYGKRAQSIGLFETSWALALLIGGPMVAILINVFGWRGPFAFLAIACGVAAIGVAISLPPATVVGSTDAASVAPNRLTGKAWLVVIASAMMAPAGLSIYLISGTWLDEEYGVSTGGLGLIVMGLGAIELMASSATAAFADRVGKFRSTLGGLIVLVGGLGVMLVASDRLWVAVAGLLILLLGFEYGFVTSLSLVSEAMPDARGTTLAIGNAVGTLTRGLGVVASGFLYEAFGLGGSAALSSGAVVVAGTALLLSRRLD